MKNAVKRLGPWASGRSLKNPVKASCGRGLAEVFTYSRQALWRRECLIKPARRFVAGASGVSLKFPAKAFWPWGLGAVWEKSSSAILWPGPRGGLYRFPTGPLAPGMFDQTRKAFCGWGLGGVFEIPCKGLLALGPRGGLGKILSRHLVAGASGRPLKTLDRPFGAGNV